MAQYHLNATNITDFINHSFSSNPLGKIYINHQSYSLSTPNKLESLSKFKKLIISTSAVDGHMGRPIYLSDVANIDFSPRELVNNSYSSYNGHPSQTILLNASSAANPFHAVAVCQPIYQTHTIKYGRQCEYHPHI